MITVFRIAPWLALAAIAWLFLDMRSEIRAQDAGIFKLEQELSAAGLEIETIRNEAAAEAERQTKAIAAIAADIERQEALTEQYRAARDSLAGLEDGDVAPVLDAALEVLR
jgi:peptidoglycan hydrolase CwlO-like protein